MIPLGVAQSVHAYTPAGISWALWNLRGAFGVVDWGREDIGYEDFKGHKLDRRLLSLLQQS